MKLSLVVANIRRGLASPGLFRWIVVLFIAQALLSAFFIAPSTPKDGVGGQYTERNENGVVPDGHRHLGAIYYYAERPILSGPVITSMSEDDLWMGDLVRFPSYLYYYLLSFPVRIAMQLGASDIAIIYLVRLIGVAFGVVSLFVFRGITRFVTKSITIQNLSALALSLTGSFVWLSAAENYDIISLMFWLAFVYAGMALFVKNQVRYLYWMAVCFFVMSITKYTYIPFAGLFGLVSVWLYLKKANALSVKLAWASLKDAMMAWLRTLAKWRLVAGAALIIVTAGLFTERIIGNLVQYQSFSPDCIQIHTQEACMNFGVYARNYNQTMRIENGTVTPIEYVPVIGYPAYWVWRYFNSMYVYMGHIYIPSYSILIGLGGIAAALIGIAALVYARLKKIRLFKTDTERYVLGIVVVVTGAQFIFNLNTILTYAGQTYAHQGRYLLSVIGFMYLLYFIVISRVYAKLSRRAKLTTLGVGLATALYSIVIVSAIPSFLIHAEHADWYSQAAQQVLPSWLINRS